MSAANPLRASINAAVQANKEFGKMFARLGSTAHPRGAILTAYRNHASALRAAKSPWQVRSVMSGLQNQVENEARRVLVDAVLYGQRNAVAQLTAYRKSVSDTHVPNVYGLPPSAELSLENAMTVISANMTQQSAAAMAVASGLTGSDDLITGDEQRQGMVRPAPVIRLLTYWIAALAGAAFMEVARLSRSDFQKQAIAALDKHTTECCLEVHGQVRLLEADFHLTGEPRFADHLDWSPFHWNCRTSIALYRAEFDDGLTERMREGADYVLAERAAGREPDQWPVDAYWNSKSD